MIATHPAVAKCAVIAHGITLKGQVPRGMLVIKSSVTIAEADLQQQLITRFSSS